MATKSRMPRGVELRLDADGKPTYRVRVRCGGITQTATLRTLEEALAWRARAKAAARGEAEPPEPPSRPVPVAVTRAVVTVEDAARRLVCGMRDGSIRTRDGKRFKPSVGRKYEEALRLGVLPLIGAVSVESLRKGDVQQLVDSLAAQRTAEHARKALTALRTLCRTCEAYGELDASPCTGVRVPVDPEPERPPRILTPQESEAITRAAYADDERLGRSFAGPLIRLAFATGLRLGELLALPWGPDGLDLAAGVVHVRRSLDRVRAADGTYPVVAPKSSSSRRDVPLSADDVAGMRRHLLASGRPPYGSLVFTLEGETPSPVPAYRGFRRAAFRAGVLLDDAPAELRALSFAAFQRRCRELEIAEPLPRFHDTRHAYATHALAAGLSAHAVARLLGHSDAGLVWRRYGHALPDELAGAAKALAEWRKAAGVH